MKKVLPVLLVLLVFPAIFQLLSSGFFVSDDGDWMIIRFTSFYQELSHFQIPVRFLHRLNYGYGYPVATFLYPGFMYLASIFKVLGFGFITSIKAVLLLSILSAFLGMFIFLKNHFSKLSALVGACLYIYSPYFLLDVYKRGSVGEVLALGIVPLILFFLDLDKRVIAAILTAWLLISHNTLALLFLPFILMYLIITEMSQKNSKKIFLSRIGIYCVLSFGVSSFFWLPVLVELPLTVFKNTTVSNFTEYFVFNYSQIGIINSLIFPSSLLFVFIKKKYSLILYFMLGVAFISLFLSLEISTFFWSSDFLGKIVQFPFRFLSLFIFAAAYLGAFLFSSVKRYRLVFAGLFVGFIILAAFPIISDVKHTNVEDLFYSTNVDTTTVKNEYMPQWVQTFPTTIPIQKVERVDKDIVQINTIYWPGHEVLVNDKKLPIDYSNSQGVMRVSTPDSIEKIVVSFQETAIRLISDCISILSLILATFLLFRKYKYV